MANFLRRLTVFFAAGALGGLANAVAVGLYKSLGAASAHGFHLAQGLNRPMLYQRVVWGGIWGLVFLLPLKAGPLAKGLWLSLAPSLVQLLVVFPARGQGMFGAQLGTFTFVQVLLFNAVWGLTAALWLTIVREN